MAELKKYYFTTKEGKKVYYSGKIEPPLIRDKDLIKYLAKVEEAKENQGSPDNKSKLVASVN